MNHTSKDPNGEQAFAAVQKLKYLHRTDENCFFSLPLLQEILFLLLPFLLLDDFLPGIIIGAHYFAKTHNLFNAPSIFHKEKEGGAMNSPIISHIHPHPTF